MFKKCIIYLANIGIKMLHVYKVLAIVSRNVQTVISTKAIKSILYPGHGTSNNYL